MPRDVSDTLLQNLLKGSTDEGLLPLLTVTWNDGTYVGTLRLVVHDQAVTSNGNSFTAADFRVKLPDEDDARTPLLQIVMQDVDLAVRTELRKLDTRYPAHALLQLGLLSDPSDIQQTFEGTIRNIRVDRVELTGSIELYREISREPLVQFLMSPAYGFNALRG